MWCSLPSDILCLVKDRLDVFDIASVNSVCHNWWSASRNYPQRQTVGDGIPWIFKRGINKTLVFTSVTREKKLIIDLPEIYVGHLHFSKQGWVLFSFSKDILLCRKTPDQLILLNPVTKARIELPEFEIDPSTKDYEIICGAYFSVEKCRPQQVVLYMRCLSCPLKLRVANVGDVVWTDYCYDSLHRRPPRLPLIGLLVIGPCIYCCYSYGVMIMYNVDTQVWKEVMEFGAELKILFYDRGNELIIPRASKNFYMDYNGKLVLHGNVNGEDRYFRYDDSDNTWKRLSDDCKIKKSIFNNFPLGYCRSLEEFLEVYPELIGAVRLADKKMPLAWVDIG